MSEGKVIISVDEKITEELLLENCLNYYYSGYDYRVLLAFYFFAKGLKYDLFIRYIKFIESTKLKAGQKLSENHTQRERENEN